MVWCLLIQFCGALPHTPQECVYLIGSVLWGAAPRPARELGSLDPVFGEKRTGFSKQRLCRLKCREHGVGDGVACKRAEKRERRGLAEEIAE